MSLKQLPNFLCLGVQKAGTSWLFEMVRQHPQVCVSDPKEPHFFNRSPNFRKGLDWYQAHFRCNESAKAIGEFTPDYLWGQDDRWLAGEKGIADVPQRVLETLPDARFLVVLRNPATRSVSAYYHHIGAGRLSARQRLGDVGDFWGIRSMGHYAEHLERWFEVFPRERFLVMVYETDFATPQQAETFRSVFEHLGVDSAFEPSGATQRYNKRRSHYDYRLSRLPGRLQRFLRNNTPEFIEQRAFWDIPVHETETDDLRRYFEPHNERLAKLLGRELPW